MSKALLFSEFPEISAKAWKQKIQVDLKGADYAENLIWEAPEGIKVKPFYHSEDLQDIAPLQTDRQAPWAIGQTIEVLKEKKANEKALDAIKRGATSISFSISMPSVDLSELLQDIDLSTTEICLKPKFISTAFVKSAVPIFSGASPCHINIDPIGHLARTGNWHITKDKDFEILEAIFEITADVPAIQPLSIDLSLFQNAGATIVQQLAYGLAQANEYLNFITHSNKWAEGNLSHLSKINFISFNLAIGSNYFFEIAKFRALRLLWAALAKEYGFSETCHIQAIPTKRNKTVYDYNVNMIRSTTECMSAVLGGADTITNMSYDHIYHEDNEFGARIARNQLLILQHESFFNEVDNPADGTYYIENITQQLAQKALALFKTIEASGGFLVQLKTHKIQQKIKESAKKEQDKYNNGEEVLVGSNKYQNKIEQMQASIERHPFVKKRPKKTLLEPIIERRLAENWEKKRLASESDVSKNNESKK